MSKNFFDMSNVASGKEIEYITNAWYKPVATEILNHFENAKTVVVAVGQYWNDEANDAVHTNFIPLSNNFESWKSCFDPAKNTYITKYDGSGSYALCDSKLERFANKRLYGNDFDGPYPNNNDDYIAALAPYCKDGCSQDMGTEEAYSPIFIYTKNDDGSIHQRFVGDVIRLLK